MECRNLRNENYTKTDKTAITFDPLLCLVLDWAVNSDHLYSFALPQKSHLLGLEGRLWWALQKMAITQIHIPWTPQHPAEAWWGPRDTMNREERSRTIFGGMEAHGSPHWWLCTILDQDAPWGLPTFLWLSLWHGKIVNIYVYLY